ncbi:hypothetical protein JOF29_007028 [Kribbella aluminosa]|uniref:Uncharacterized protein n=1 Tax=Kribbella aluminosa TaxID=416017 RepID=A0ABS4UW85_9ACTN|nr:hypothetical protein [Kribbella aluminosa]MBP2355918.1 hypothetical protein [Kribbella aluminosa]
MAQGVGHMAGPLKIRLVALMFCPDLDKHPELNRGFAHDLRDALGFDEAA